MYILGCVHEERKETENEEGKGTENEVKETTSESKKKLQFAHKAGSEILPRSISDVVVEWHT